MAIKCLSPQQQTAIIEGHKDGNSHTDLALAFGVGVTTIRRVLAEHKIIPPLAFHKSREEVEMLGVLAMHNISTAQELRDALKPPLTQLPNGLTPAPTIAFEDAVASTAINVASFKAGDEYYSEAEGWVKIKSCEYDEDEGEFYILDTDNSPLFVGVNGRVDDRDFSEFDITDHRLASANA